MNERTGDRPHPVNTRHVTMGDVAEHAGVSMKSVSRVINNEPHVSAKLRTRVEQVIATLGYVPDTAARSLAGARSFVIGVMFDNPSPNYVMKVIAGAYAACVEQRYHLRFDHVDSGVGDDNLVRRFGEILQHSRCDGFVLTPPLCDNPLVLDMLERRGIAFCRIAPVFEPERSPSVSMDDQAAAAAVAELFYARGHRAFGFIGGPGNHGAAHRRRDGFLERIHTLDPKLRIAEVPGDFSFQAGIAGGKALLGGAARPTAIFAANDDMAAGAMAACQQFGLKVPEDVSICGFDDSWVTSLVHPALTTVHQPIEAMAHAAASMLIARSTSDGLVHRRFDFVLIERKSVAAR